MDCKRKQCNCSGLNCMICFLGVERLTSSAKNAKGRLFKLWSRIWERIWFGFIMKTMTCYLSDLDARLALTYENILHTQHTTLYLLIHDYPYLLMHVPPFFSFPLSIWFIIWCCSNACFVNATVLHFVALSVPLCPLANHLGPLSILPVPPLSPVLSRMMLI